VAPGAVIAASASIIPGAAQGGVTAPGANLQALASIIPGLATGAALAPGATIPAQAIIIPGDVTLSGATAIPRDPLTAATARLASIPAAPRGAFTPA
jgi:hypothetical protein